MRLVHRRLQIPNVGVEHVHYSSERVNIMYFSKSETNINDSSLRLHGSYEALKYGTTLDGLSDLTGGIAENVPLKSESTGSRELLASLLRMTTVVLVKVGKESNPESSSNNKSLNEKNKENKVR